jgi:DNA-binding response OmpR family regulator
MLLPDIPGTDLTRQLRTDADADADAGSDGDGDGTRILAITAYTGDGTRDLALSAGADQFMTKPFAMNQLLEQAQALTSDRAS